MLGPSLVWVSKQAHFIHSSTTRPKRRTPSNPTVNFFLSEITGSMQLLPSKPIINLVWSLLPVKGWVQILPYQTTKFFSKYLAFYGVSFCNYFFNILSCWQLVRSFLQWRRRIFPRCISGLGRIDLVSSGIQETL